MRRLLPLLLLLPLAGCGPATPTDAVPADGVALTAVKVADLKRVVASHRGKVVVIDCWFLGCRPCREKFPRVMQMRRDLEKDGLVLMTLDIYQPDLKEREKVLDFLRTHDATNPNYIFDDTEDAVDGWLSAHDAFSVPQFAVFDRDGRRVVVPDFPGQDETKWEKERAWVKELVERK